MVLIADSGSTKCDWVLKLSDGEFLEFNTIGYNPLFHPEKQIIEALESQEKLRKHKEGIEEIYFFGAGNSTPKAKSKLILVLKKVFPNAGIIEPYTDVHGAALATYDGRDCISCILGTGANAIFFDGQKILSGKPALGYILGDEGSGAYFGKKLLAAYLNKLLPDHIQEDFFNQYGLMKKDIIERVYRGERPNAFLASFMPFISKHREDESIQKMLQKGFRSFLLIQVMCYEQFRKVPVHFVGSVAHYFQDEINQEANRLGIQTGQFIQRPINQLKLLNLQYFKSL
ncbi:MAG: hypothetical protein DWQ02_11340 [Bacteroidetes bacterium]|nr:MAG: hypothetical protein DWQ02_11340 [Bacteroidota bacterium]